jgi:hypothetical protein
LKCFYVPAVKKALFFNLKTGRQGGFFQPTQK